MPDDHASLVEHSRAAVKRSWALRRQSIRAAEETQAIIAASKDLLCRIAEREAATIANLLLPCPPRPT
jgi:hypothetical protein